MTIWVSDVDRDDDDDYDGMKSVMMIEKMKNRGCKTRKRKKNTMVRDREKIMIIVKIKPAEEGVRGEGEERQMIACLFLMSLCLPLI